MMAAAPWVGEFSKVSMEWSLCVSRQFRLPAFSPSGCAHVEWEELLAV